MWVAVSPLDGWHEYCVSAREKAELANRLLLRAAKRCCITGWRQDLHRMWSVRSDSRWKQGTSFVNVHTLSTSGPGAPKRNMNMFTYLR